MAHHTEGIQNLRNLYDIDCLRYAVDFINLYGGILIKHFNIYILHNTETTKLICMYKYMLSIYLYLYLCRDRGEKS